MTHGTPEQAAKGVVAWSSGNHAQGVALAGKLLGIHAAIVMPADAPAAKLESTRRLGGEIITYDRYSEDREAIARVDGDQWQSRQDGQWKNTGAAVERPAQRPETRPATRPATPTQRPATQPSTRPATRPSTPSPRPSLNTRDLDRSYQARQRGHSREMARPMPRGGHRGRR